MSQETSHVLFIGVDVHRERNVAQVIDEQGKRVGKPIVMHNNRSGIQKFRQQVAALCTQGGYESVQLATEAANHYWQGMFYTMREDPAWAVSLYAINPRLIVNYKKALLVEDHTDESDAQVIAGRLRMGVDLPTSFEVETVYAPLRVLTRQRFHLVQTLAREKGYATHLVYQKFSEYTVPDKQPFAKTFGPTSRAVLRHFTTREEILAIPLPALANWIDERGRHRFADAQEVARKLQDVVRESFVLPAEFNLPLQLSLDTSLSVMEALEQQIKRVDQAITQALRPVPNPLTTVPGIGPVYAAGILAEIGDVHCFGDDDNKVARFAGLTWRKHQSGDFVAEDTPLSLHCNRYLRYYLVEAADSVRKNEPEYKAFYHKKFGEVTRHQHKRAIVLTARKLVRLVTRLLASQQPYQARGATPA